MLVSAITPTYNRWKYVPSVIASFLAQTCTDSELVIVDDGELYPGYEVPFHPRIWYTRLEGPRRSVGEKRNICCDLARGEFICQFDDDDWSGPERMADQAAALTLLEKQVLGYHNALIFDETYRSAHRYNAENGTPLWAFAHGATFCYRKSWWKQFPFEDRTGKEDSFFAKAADKRGEFASKDAGDNIVIRAHRWNTYKPPLDRIARVGGEEMVPSGFFDKL